jgi:hypothetical protein
MVPAMTAMAMTAMAAAAGASASTTAPTAAAAPAPELVVEAAKGFIDDPVTFDPDGDRVAVIETDSSSFARVRVIDLATGKDARSPPLPDPRLVFDRLLFTGSQGGIVVVSRRPDGARLAELFALDGMRLGQAGPASDFAVAMRAGQRHLVAWTTRPAAGGGTAATVTPHRLDTLAPAGKPRVLALGADGGLPKPPLSFWGWQDGYTRIAGQLPGGYDAKTDVRQPARAAVFDVLDSAVIEEKPIGDVEAWVRARELRRTRGHGRPRRCARAPPPGGARGAAFAIRRGLIGRARRRRLRDPLFRARHRSAPPGSLGAAQGRRGLPGRVSRPDHGRPRRRSQRCHRRQHRCRHQSARSGGGEDLARAGG